MTAPAPNTVIVIGAGIAGLWTALKLAPQPVVLLTGSPLGDGAASGWAQGGVAAALAADDSADLHAIDTIAAGAGLVDPDAAQALAESAAAEIEALAALGAPFEREDEAWALSREAAHSKARVARVKGDGAGAAIMDVLIRAVRDADHIDIREGWRAIDLIAGRTGCAGAIARDPAGARHEIHAGQTVLALGGAGGLFALTTTPPGAQGQAMAMAARLGAAIRDPEFVQFHPTALDAGLDPAPLCTEALRGEGATLIDAAGERFMPALHPLAELAPRDIVARAVARQAAKGGAFLDCRTAIGDAFPDRFPAVFAACMAAGIDPRRQPIPVAPTAHYHMGGVMTDLDGFTNVPGLWAVGECASTGLHGANRLASNSLAEGLVAGARCAKAIPLQGPSTTAWSLSPVPGEESKRGGHDSSHSGEVSAELTKGGLSQLRQAMSRHCGVERSASGLTDLLTEIDRLESEHGPADAIIAARFIATGALLRQESRGGHARSDFPETSNSARHTVLTLDDIHPARLQAAE